MEIQGTRVAKTILKKNKCGAFTFPKLKTYHKATVIQTVYGEGKDYPLQYSYLDNPMDRGASQAIVHGVAKEPATT